MAEINNRLTMLVVNLRRLRYKFSLSIKRIEKNAHDRSAGNRLDKSAKRRTRVFVRRTGKKNVVPGHEGVLDTVKH